MNQEERASQLSAMFDGELPAAECELLSRRLARDEHLRATWSRYSVIGAALRAEPMAEVHPDFARRVSAALASPGEGASGRQGLRGEHGVAGRRGRLLRSAALGAVVAVGVAGAAIMLLRNGLPGNPTNEVANQEDVLTSYTPSVVRVAVPTSATQSLLAGGINLRIVGADANSSRELASYVVPPLSPTMGLRMNKNGSDGGKDRGFDNALETPMSVPVSLADYVVAHSEVSSPLARGSLLSELVGNELVQPAPTVVAPTLMDHGRH